MVFKGMLQQYMQQNKFLKVLMKISQRYLNIYKIINLFRFQNLLIKKKYQFIIYHKAKSKIQQTNVITTIAIVVNTVHIYY